MFKLKMQSKAIRQRASLYVVGGYDSLEPSEYADGGEAQVEWH
jgi:hypothetical protein